MIGQASDHAPNQERSLCLYWRRAPSEEAAGAMLLAATALASPYLFSYDLPFPAMPVFFLSAWRAAQAGGHGRSWRWW